MRGIIWREGTFTLQIEWISAEGLIVCDGCKTEESGEYFTVVVPDGQPFVLCHTCAVWLAGDLEYALR